MVRFVVRFPVAEQRGQRSDHAHRARFQSSAPALACPKGDGHALKVDVRPCEPARFGQSRPGVEKHVNEIAFLADGHGADGGHVLHARDVTLKFGFRVRLDLSEKIGLPKVLADRPVHARLQFHNVAVRGLRAVVVSALQAIGVDVGDGQIVKQEVPSHVAKESVDRGFFVGVGVGLAAGLHIVKIRGRHR